MALAGSLPVVKIVSATATPLLVETTSGGGGGDDDDGGRTMVVRVELRNEGFLPTNGSAKAIEMGAVRSAATVTFSCTGGSVPGA